MKKFIKDWWPLLLIAGWWLWKKHKKGNKILPTGAGLKKYEGHRVKYVRNENYHYGPEFIPTKEPITPNTTTWKQNPLYVGQDSAGRIMSPTNPHYYDLYPGAEFNVTKVERTKQLIAGNGWSEEVEQLKVYRSNPEGFYWFDPDNYDQFLKIID